MATTSQSFPRLPADADTGALANGTIERVAPLSEIVPVGRASSVLEEIMAGMTPTRPVVAGTCSRIMTGAPIPQGANAVVMQEMLRGLNELFTAYHARRAIDHQQPE